MDVLVLNTDFEMIYILDQLESVIWTDRFNTCGDVEICAPMRTSLLTYIKQGNYLQIPFSDRLMMIEEISITSNAEEGDKLMITGRSLETILERRIVWGQAVLSGNFQEAIEALFNQNIINPTITARKIPNFIFEYSENPSITALTIDAQYLGDNLYDIITGLCEQYAIGFKIVLDSEHNFVFSFYTGEDRSYNQVLNPYVIFSPLFDNISSSNYLESIKAYKNVTLVAGEGEGAERKTIAVGDAAGLERREVFTDASGVSSNIDGGTLTDAEYYAQLSEKGNNALAELQQTKSFDGEAETTKLFKYGKDFFIGDVVQIEDAYGHNGIAYISELIISQNAEGLTIYPTFNTISAPESYSGAYNVIPKPRDQILYTKDFVMREDIVVEPIPYKELSNRTGLTVRIG